MTQEQTEQRLEYLRDLLETGRSGNLEEIEQHGFPPSAIYPSYWSGAGPGAKLAFELLARIRFSQKLFSIEVLQLENEAEINIRRIRFNRERARGRRRIDHIRTEVARLKEAMQNETVNRQTDRVSGEARE